MITCIRQLKPTCLARLAPLTILVITGIIFLNTLGNNFIENFDDNLYILDNDIIKHLNWYNLKEIFFTFFEGNYHPVTLLSYAVEYKFFGLNPFIFHLTNYILHLLNTLLVYLFIRRFTGKVLVAAITSLFFGIHPMHVESVAWISERKDLLYTFFFLLSLICYAKYVKVEKKKAYLIWAFVWFLLSLLSKSAAVCLPLVLVLIDYYHDKKVSWQTFNTKIPFFVFSLVFGILAIFSQRSVESIITLPLFTVLDRVFLFSYAILFYLFRAFFPLDLSIMHYYPVKINGILPVEYYISLPILLVLIWGIFKSGRFKNELIFGFLFYLTTIFLVLQIIPVGPSLVSERYSYIPYIGLFFIISQLFSHVINAGGRPMSVIKIFVSFILILGLVFYSYLAYQRNKLWKNGEVMFTDVITKYPGFAYGWYALGNSENLKNDQEMALKDYTKAIELAPDFAGAYFNRGNAEYAESNLTTAILDYTKTIALSPEFINDVYVNRGNAEFAENNFDAAVMDYTKVIQSNPAKYLAYLGLGTVEDTKQNFDAAIMDYTKVIELSPNYVNAYFSRGNSENKKRDFNSAIVDYTKTIELSPTFAAAYLNRGNSESAEREFNLAMMDYRKTIELDPGNSSAYFNCGLVDDTRQDFRGAIAAYTKAIELSPGFLEAYVNRAFIYYTLGKYQMAIVDFTKGLSLRSNDNIAYYYRGMAELNLNDKGNACSDLASAQQYGNPMAAGVLKQYCK